MTTEDEPIDQPVLRVRGPADLAQAIPYLLGFHPESSLVLVGLHAGRVNVTARVDLDAVADGGDAAMLSDTLAAMARGDTDRVVAVIFDDDADVPIGGAGTALPWRRLAADIERAVDAVSCDLADVALVCRGRLWSYVCPDPTCCPAEGRPIDEATSVAAEAIYAGLVALPDRAALAASLDPAPDRERLIPALDVAEFEAVGEILRGDDARLDRSVKRALFAAARQADEPGVAAELGDEQLVRFGVALQRFSVRDPVWIAIDESRIDGRRLWRALAAQLPAPFDAPPLFLFAWASYRAGDGALAGIAAERALASDPAYTAADLVLAALSRAIDPRSLPRLRASRRDRPASTAAARRSA